MWDSSNDGAGSGLDADTLDGLSSASFLHTYAESSQITPTTASTMSFSHGLGARPEKFGVFLEAASATYGFAVGDRVAAVSGDGDGARQVVVWANATTVNFKAPSNMIVRCPDGSNRYITDGSGVFKVVLWAEKRP